MQIVKPCPTYTPITSDFGPRVAPKPGASTYHYGIDFGGTFKVTAARSGKVITVGRNMNKTNGFGHYVIIRHTELTKTGLKYWDTLYAHGAKATHLKVGDKVRAGEHIFTSGSTGSATGDHLHFELRKRVGWGRKAVWVKVDPARYWAK